MTKWFAALPMLGAAALVVACSDAPTSASRSTATPTVRLSGGVSGASFTTTNVAVDGPGHCRNGSGLTDAINCNIYDGKIYVWIEGGPLAASLEDGTYFFAVLVPGGQNNDVNDFQGAKNLSDDYDLYTDRTFTVTGGVISYAGPHDFANNNIRLAPYATTTNPGGEYDVAVCQYDPAVASTYPVDPKTCKYDNFKVREGDILTQYGTLTVDKFYDADADGIQDAGEIVLTGWDMTLNPGAWTQGTPASFTLLDPGTYSVTEGVPTGPGEAAAWFITYKGGSSGLLADNLLAGSIIRLSVATANDLTIPGINVVAGASESRLFGNVCIAGGGGHTLGYWSNKNGQSTMNDGGSLAPELAMLVGLNLRNPNGTNFDPTTYTQFRNWLLAGDAVNMAYMLSVQLSAMELNVEAGFVLGSAVIYAPGTTSANTLGFATVSAVMAEANTSLGTYGLTPSGHAERAHQEALKTALDNANNNLNFVQSSPCGFTF